MTQPATRLELSGAVTLATHGGLRDRLGAAVAAGDVVVDWHAVTDIDSSALALIFHGRRRAASAGHAIAHEQLPPALDALAELYGVRDLLGSAVGR